MKANRFRFRAWDTINKVMYNNVDMSSGGKVSSLSIMRAGYRIDKSYPTILEILDKIDKGTHLIPMQSTGLCDKNGKEIFEGDVVKADYGLGDPPQIVDLPNFFWCKGECLISDDIEIIGNIYESPELLSDLKG
jgi:hypothetical protein